MNAAQTRVLIGSILMIASLLLPITIYSINGSRVYTYGYQSNLVFAALIGVCFLLLSFSRKGTPGKRYALWASILSVIAMINIIFVFLNVGNTIGIALPVCMFGAFATLFGCMFEVRR
jgi:hypothetical protein